MSEKLIIDNFAGIKHMELDIGRINILIGPQASGKSVCAKLHYYFVDFIFYLIEAEIKKFSKTVISKDRKKKFSEYFPILSWGDDNFIIRYENDGDWILLERMGSTSRKIKLNYSESFKAHLNETIQNISKLLDPIKEIYPDFDFPDNLFGSLPIDDLLDRYHMFIPSGRSYYAMLRSNIFTILDSTISIDPIILQFGKHYERIRNVDIEYSELKLDKRKILKSIEKNINSLLNGRLLIENDYDFIMQDSKRKVNLSYASSGQQELLPLLMSLKFLYYKQNVDNHEHKVAYIEEPEAHIFPDAQKKVVEIIATVYNNAPDKLQFFITTHSPYILTAFNNLMYAGIIEKDADQEKKKQLYKTIPKEKILDPDVVRVYALEGGKAKSIIDPESGLIDANVLDEVSNETAKEFDTLLDLE